MSRKTDGDKALSGVAHNSNAKLRALVVDRDSISSQLLADSLARNLQCEATGVASTDLLKAISVWDAGLVVIGAELRYGTGNGLTLARVVSRAYPQVDLVILLDHVSRTSVIEAFRSGARGVFSRQQSMHDFHDCVGHVRKGFIWAGRTESNILLEALKSVPAPVISVDSGAHPLTARELQVVQKAAQGKTNRTIARELNLSEHTVKNYLFRAYEKVGVSSRIELLFYLTVHGHASAEVAVDAAEIVEGSHHRIGPASVGDATTELVPRLG
jgi:DNA-binding NarL/FixJ family response regulator